MTSFRAKSRMERLGKARHGREGRRLSERDVSKSNPRGDTLYLATGFLDFARNDSKINSVSEFQFGGLPAGLSAVASAEEEALAKAGDSSMLFV